MTEIIKSSGDVFKDLEVARPSTMASHTPGPWKAHRNSSFWEISPVYRGENDPYDIGNVCSSAPFHPDGGLQEANARLMAAAPDLLEALDMARKYMKMCLGSSFWDGPNPYPIIDAALAKARGEVDA